MNKDVRFSSVPVGEKIEYKGEIYTRFTHYRGKSNDNTFLRFPKHRIVTWINAWPTNIDE